MSRTLPLRPCLGALLLIVPGLLLGCSQSSSDRITTNKPVAEQPPALPPGEAPPPEASAGGDSEQQLQQKNQDVAEGQTQSTEINPSQQLVEIKALAPEKVRVGEAYDYEIHVSNTSEQASVSQVKVQHTIPEGFEIESSEPEAEQAEGSATWTLAQLGPGETQKIRIRGISDQEGAANACLSVTYTPTVCLTTQFVKPEIEVAKQAPDHSRLCDPIPITYRVTNHGTGAAKNVEVTDELPEGLQTMDGQQTVSFQIDELPAGQSQDFETTVVAGKAGEFASRATAKAEGGEESRSSETTTTVQAARLEAAIDGPSVEYIGRMLTYNVSVKNSGNVPAENVTLQLQPPEGLRQRWRSELSKASSEQASQPQASAAQASGQPTPAADPAAEKAAPTEEAPAANEQQAPPPADREAAANQDAAQAPASGLTWQVGTLRPGELAQARVSFVGRQAGAVEIQAIAQHDCAAQKEDAQVTASTQTELIALPALAVAVADTPDPVKVGEEVRYVITVVNEGNADDKQIKVTATLPESLEHVDHAGSSKGSLEGQTLTFEPIETLKPGEEVAWTVRAKARSAENTRLSVNVTSESQDEATAEEPTRLFDESDVGESASKTEESGSKPASVDEEPKEQ